MLFLLLLLPLLQVLLKVWVQLLLFLLGWCLLAKESKTQVHLMWLFGWHLAQESQTQVHLMWLLGWHLAKEQKTQQQVHLAQAPLNWMIGLLGYPLAKHQKTQHQQAPLNLMMGLLGCHPLVKNWQVGSQPQQARRVSPFWWVAALALTPGASPRISSVWKTFLYPYL